MGDPKEMRRQSRALGAGGPSYLLLPPYVKYIYFEKQEKTAFLPHVCSSTLQYKIARNKQPSIPLKMVEELPQIVNVK